MEGSSSLQQAAAAASAANLHLLLLCHVVVWLQPACTLSADFVQSLHDLQVSMKMQ